MTKRKTKPDDAPPHIAIAIELDYPLPWHQDCYEGILQFANQKGWSCVVDPYLVGMSEVSGVSQYAGVVGRIDAQAAKVAYAHGIPVVNHWSGSPVVKELNNVLTDNRSAAKLASEHLLACGFRRLAVAGPIQHRSDKIYLQGVAEVSEAQGLAAPEVLAIENDFESHREGVLKVRRMFTDWLSQLDSPIGVMSRLSVAARYLAQVCTEVNKRVPNDVAIVSLSGDTMVNYSSTPTLSVVEQDYIRLGYEAASKLDELMRHKQGKPTTRLVAPNRLTVRDSSDVFHSSDPLVSEAMRYIADHCTAGKHCMSTTWPRR